MPKQVSDKKDPRRFWGIAVATAVVTAGFGALVLTQCSKRPERAPVASGPIVDDTLGRDTPQVQAIPRMKKLIAEYRQVEPDSFNKIATMVTVQKETVASLINAETIAALSGAAADSNGNRARAITSWCLYATLFNIRSDTARLTEQLTSQKRGPTVSQTLSLFPEEAKRPVSQKSAPRDPARPCP